MKGVPVAVPLAAHLPPLGQKAAQMMKKSCMTLEEGEAWDRRAEGLSLGCQLVKLERR
jgi:hypothetical protein